MVNPGESTISTPVSRAPKAPAASKVAPVVKRGPAPSLREMVEADPAIKAFLEFVRDEDLRESAMRSLNRAITKKRPLVVGMN